MHKNALSLICRSLPLLMGVCLFTEAALPRLYAGEDIQSPERDAREKMPNACGPQCVRYVLHCYGQEEELVKLIRETQWSQVDAAASLSSLNQALRNRGVFTYAMRVPVGTELHWPFPVLLHLCVSEKMGHFSVWVPDSTIGSGRIWDGLGGLGSKQTNCLPSRCSGAILLTSPRPIVHPEDAISRPLIDNRWVLCLLAAGPLLLAVIGFRRRLSTFFTNLRSSVRRQV
jgi:hypothetical protein